MDRFPWLDGALLAIKHLLIVLSHPLLKETGLVAFAPEIVINHHMRWRL
jgi:hypothetical protein